VQVTKFVPMEDFVAKATLRRQPTGLRRQSTKTSLAGSFGDRVPGKAAAMLGLRRQPTGLRRQSTKTRLMLSGKRRGSMLRSSLDGPQVIEMPIRQMGKGEHFGVQALVEKDGLHVTNELALVHCELQVLKRRRFERMVEEFPEFHAQADDTDRSPCSGRPLRFHSSSRTAPSRLDLRRCFAR
jgi:hypothetical protein